MALACPVCRSVVPDLAKFCPVCGTQIANPGYPSFRSSGGPSPEPRSSEPPLAAGATLELGFGRVVIGSHIGDGGMGAVHRAWLYFDPKGPQRSTPPTEVAVKLLHPSLFSRARVRKLFAGEAEALRRLSHPNIVRFYGLSETAHQLAIVMELVEGQALSAVIERHIQRAQRDGLAKLTDYGIARLPADVARTTGSVQPGTGAYMSPEQVLGEPLDGRSDLYSAAIVLYEMVSGRTPFEAPDRSEFVIRAAQVEEQPRRMTELVPQAPPVIDQLFARGLAKNPGDRFSTAIELGNAFRMALNLPDTMGWQAQQVLAGHAVGIAGAPSVRRREGTIPVPPEEANAMRERVNTAYRGS